MIKKQAKQIFWNAMLLTAASLLMRTVGVSFQVYVSNRAGAETMGLFSLMSGVYGFALTLATSGIHLGVTRVVTEAIGTGHHDCVRPAMRRALLYSLVFGVGASVLLYSLAEQIGLLWLKDARTVRSLRLFAISLPMISLSSSLSGYFTAVRRAYKNAVSQVFEQGVKIMLSMYLLAALLPKGIEATCCALVLGGTFSEIASFLFNGTLYLLDKDRKRRTQGTSDGRLEGRKLLDIALPIALTAYIRSGLLTLQHILIPEGLRSSGSSHAEALVAYGSIQSMALPVILYPAALIASFSGLLIPEMSASRVQGHKKRISYMISRVWFLSLLFSIGTAGILICFSARIGEALYPNTNAGYYIRVLAPLIPIMYVDTATDAMMKGLGEQVYSMFINILDAALSVVLVVFLIPRYGIGGYLITIYVSEIFNTVLSVHHLLSITKTPVRLLKWVYKPLFCIVGATMSGKLLLPYVCRVFGNGLLSTVLLCAVAVVLYLLLLRVTQSIDKEDILWFSTLFSRDQKKASVGEKDWRDPPDTALYS